MHWLAQDFEALRARLLEDPHDATVSEYMDDFLNLTAKKPKSAESRSRLDSKTITINGEQLTLNDEFVIQTLGVASALDIDELVAAELLFQGIDAASVFDRSPIYSAVFVYYKRLSYLIECLRLIFVGANLDFIEALLDASETGSGAKPYFSRLIDALSSTHQDLGRLDTKFHEAYLSGQSNDPGYIDMLQAQQRQTFQLFDALSVTFYTLTTLSTPSSSDITNLINFALQFKDYSSWTLQLLPPIAGAFWRFCNIPIPSDSPISFHAKLKTLLASNEHWPSALLLLWLVHLSTYCRVQPEPVSLDYHKDITDPAIVAVKQGAFELLMLAARDSNPQKLDVGLYDFVSHFSSSLTSPPSILPSNILFAPLFDVLENLIVAIIRDLADILREIKIMEEDNGIKVSERSFSEIIDDSESTPCYLEQFYILISALYRSRPDSSLHYWNDTDSDLYGFLVWASECHTSIISSAYFDMISSLCTGPDSATAAYQFFLPNPDNETTVFARTRKTFRMSWHDIFNAISVFNVSKGTKSKTADSLTVSEPKVSVDFNPDSILELMSFLRFIYETARFSEDAREYFFTEPDFALVKTLSGLLQGDFPVNGSVFLVLSAVYTTDSEKHSSEIWDIIKSMANPKQETNEAVSSTKQEQSSPSTNASLSSYFYSPSDVKGFIYMLHVLLNPDDDKFPHIRTGLPCSSTYWPTGVRSIVETVLSIFFETTSEAFSADERIRLQGLCLSFILDCLSRFDSDYPLFLRNSGVDLDKATFSKSFSEFLHYHPATWVFDLLFDEKINGLFFALSSAAVELVEELEPDHPLCSAVSSTFSIVDKILEMQNVYFDLIYPSLSANSTTLVSPYVLVSRGFEEVILANISFVTELAIYSCSIHSSIGKPALMILKKLANSTLFSSFPKGQSGGAEDRFLGAFSTADESRRIKLDFIYQLQSLLSDELQPEAYEACFERVMENLQFINESIKADETYPSVGCFILGYNIDSLGAVSINGDTRGNIASDSSLFDLLVAIIQGGLGDIVPGFNSGVNFAADACTLLAVSFEIILKLCRSELTGNMTLEYLRQKDFFLSILDGQKFLTNRTLWNGTKFNDTDEFFLSDGSKALEGFLSYRASALECLARELYNCVENEKTSTVAKYMTALLSSGNNSKGLSDEYATLLFFLDIWDLRITVPNLADMQLESPWNKLNIQSCVRQKGDGRFELDLDLVSKLIYLKRVEISKPNVSEPSTGEKAFLTFMTMAKRRDGAAFYQKKAMNAWGLLASTIASIKDPEHFPALLGILYALVPKLQDAFVASEIMGSIMAAVTSDVVVACTLNQDKTPGNNISKEQAASAFSVAIVALGSPSTNQLNRASLYVICYCYLRSVTTEDTSSQDLTYQALRSISDRILNIIGFDGVTGEDECRDLALSLLLGISTLSADLGSDRILKALIRQNILFQLVDSILRYEQSFLAINKKSISDSSKFDLVPGYTGYQSLLSLLTTLASSKIGASHIVECGLLGVLKRCKFIVFSDSMSEFQIQLVLPVLRLIIACVMNVSSRPRMLTKLHDFLGSRFLGIVPLFASKANEQSLPVSVRPKHSENYESMIKLLTTLISISEFKNYYAPT
ncbi:hypothetical protein CANCADRAFT_4547 [Tortispora caseinolytica NRRL Y-17796]|uniref:Uncharacterized protein n=1 Tax=Tortispora caseinolytica NRRL Y-17796 TaxID=767744 RepID=A0A1E4T9I0_9ASCO|nr:hypothetical protein CANCADRAFT_4547 [Tortispora caseinolytica NRRL Y-17796]